MSDGLSTEPSLDLGRLRQAIQEEITWQADVFSGAPQASSAAEFGTEGINFCARKAADGQEWQAALASLACEVPTPL